MQDLTEAKSLLYKVIILFEKCLQMIWLPHAINVKLNLYNDRNTQEKNIKTTELEKAERFETEKIPSTMRIYCYPGPFCNCNINQPLIDFCSHSIFFVKPNLNNQIIYWSLIYFIDMNCNEIWYSWYSFKTCCR